MCIGLKMEGFVKTLAKLLPSLPTEVRIRALNCIENLLRDVRVDTIQLTEKWYHLLGPEPMDVISKYAKNPFVELRLAGLGVVNAIACQPWGQEAIKNTPGAIQTSQPLLCCLTCYFTGLIEFLLDRSIETDKECKEAKYDIIKLLSQSTVFDHGQQEKLQVFVREGPFYVQAVTEVAIEGD